MLHDNQGQDGEFIGSFVSAGLTTLLVGSCCAALLFGLLVGLFVMAVS